LEIDNESTTNFGSNDWPEIFQNNDFVISRPDIERKTENKNFIEKNN